MKFFQALATAALACAPIASAWECLSDADAQNIIDRQRTFLLRQNVTAGREAVETLFSPNLLELSDSINALRGVTVSPFSERPFIIATTTILTFLPPAWHASLHIIRTIHRRYSVTAAATSTQHH